MASKSTRFSGMQLDPIYIKHGLVANYQSLPSDSHCGDAVSVKLETPAAQPSWPNTNADLQPSCYPSEINLYSLVSATNKLSADTPPLVKSKKKRIRAPVLKRPVCSFVGCNMSFSTSGHLARHYKIHSGIRAHRCPIDGCEKTFARRDNMIHHHNTHKRKLEAKERNTVQKPHISAVVKNGVNNSSSPTGTLYSEADNLSSSTSSNSGQTAASVSPTHSFTGNMKTTSSTSTFSSSNQIPSSGFDGNLLHQRRPRSAPLSSINTSSTFLNRGNNFHQAPLSSTAGFVNQSLLSAGATFDITQTFFDSPAFPQFPEAPLSVPVMNMHLRNRIPYTVQSSQQYHQQHPLSLENFTTTAPNLKINYTWSPKAAFDQFDEHFSTFSLSQDERNWSTFSLDFLSVSNTKN